MFVRTAAGAIVGIDAVPVAVEVNVANAGQLGLFLVGLPDNAVRESQERIRAAFGNCSYRMSGKKNNKRQNFNKMIIRIICFVLAISMVATTLFLLIQYLVYYI